MPDQPGGKANMEGLATEQSSQRAQSIFNNTSSSNAMSGWKNNLMKFLGSKSPTQQSRPAVAPGQTSKTLFGAADPNVPGGPKEVQTVNQQIAQQPATQPAVRQPIANPAGAQHNPSKEASMKKESNTRIEQVLTLLKFAACMKKNMKPKKMKKRGEEEVPGVSVGGPLGAAGIGAGLGAAGIGVQREGARALPKIIQKLDDLGHQELADKILESLTKLQPTQKRVLQAAGHPSALRAYGPAALGTAALVGGPVWAGAAAAKRKGGAGRGAAVGTGTGAGIGALGGLAGALATRKAYGGFGKALSKLMLPATVTGAEVGAVGGAIGGGIQKRRRTKAQEKAKGKKTERKTEKSEKEAALRKVAAMHKSATGLPWGKILGGLGIGAGGLGIGAGLLAGGPPLMRGASHHLGIMFDPSYAEGWRNQRLMNDMQRQMMQMQMARMYSPYGGMGGIPPMMDPEDRAMMNHANYLRGLRARAKTMQEAFGD